MCIFPSLAKHRCKYLQRSKSVLSRLQVLAGAFFIICAAPAHAQNAPNSLDAATIEDQIAQGDSLFNGYDKRALQVLADAARASLDAISANNGARLLTALPEQMPQTGPLSTLTARAARAHLLWGQAADRFGERDISIMALARSYRLAGINYNATNLVSRDALRLLNAQLRLGLPQIAADDTLDTLSTLGLWKPLRFRFALSPSVLGPGQTAAQNVDLMVTQGQLFPGERREARADDDKTRLAPLYRNVSPDVLPAVLKLGYMTVGFERLNDGPNRGLWQQAARVYYPHPLFTRGNRNDRPRAEALCAQFLRVRALDHVALGLDNNYKTDGVTELWLSEVSALWPDDDDDIEMADLRGARMPPVNVRAPENLPPSIEPLLLSAPWMAAGQIDSAPGDIVFFKTGQSRSEWEWLREIAHEYGHVVLPPAAGFRPPLEPYANGALGETLAMLWIAPDSASYEISNIVKTNANAPRVVSVSPVAALPNAPRSKNDDAPETVWNNSPQAMTSEALGHIRQNALPSLRLWNAQGPNSPLRRDTSAVGLNYLEGFNVWIERVYGGDILGATAQNSLRSTVNSYAYDARLTPTNTENLLNDFQTTMQSLWKTRKVLPVWLPGALETVPDSLPAEQLAARAPLTLLTGARVALRFYVPPNTARVQLQWRGKPGALKIEGLNLRPSRADANDLSAATFDFAQNGWQRLVLSASDNATLLGARLEVR